MGAHSTLWLLCLQKAWLINILSALRTMLLVILAFFLFSPFYQATNTKAYYRFLVFITALTNSISKTVLDGTVLRRDVKRVERMGLNVKFSFNNCRLDIR